MAGMKRLTWLLFLAALSLSAVAQTVNSFDGITAAQLTRPGYEVDANGAVGTKQFLEYSSIYYQAYDKVTFAPVWNTPQQITGVFTNHGMSDCSNISGDGVVIFDRLASRWVMGAHTATPGTYFYCIAVSNTDDLTSTTLKWNTYEISLNPLLGTNPQGHVYFPDWPKLGTWPDAYYLAIDLNDTDQNFREVGILACALDRTNMLAGGTAKSPQCFKYPSSIPGTVYLGHSLIPGDVDGNNPPPAGRHEYFVSIENPVIDQVTTTSTTFNLWDFHVDWNNPANSTFTQTTPSVSSYTPGCYETSNPAQTVCVPEPSTQNTGQHIDSVGDRLMPRLAYRNYGGYESFLFAHVVQVGNGQNSQTGIRWYELRGSGTPAVSRWGTLSPDNSQYRFMPSISEDQNANVAIGYSISGTSTHPGISASWWNLPDSTLPSEFQVYPGIADEENTWHWGSYTTMTVDPVDNCTFWYTNEYFPTNQTGNSTTWATRIANFQVPNCGIVSPGPNSLTFGSQNVGTTSAPQVTMLYNGQNRILNISGFTFTGANSGDFGQTNTCGTTLAAGQACAINVTFTPSATGNRSATLNINDDAANSPQTVALSGTGTGGLTVTVSPSTLSFGKVNVGTTSPTKNVTVTNTGSAAVSISNIGITGTNAGDFGQTNNCGSSLGVGASCTIGVAFTPTVTGKRSAVLSISDNADGSPQQVTLTGFGTQPAVNLNPTLLSFGRQKVGTRSTPQNVTLTNTGSGTLSITSIRISGTNAGDFAQSNNCGKSVAPGASCTISVTFAPTAIGIRRAAIAITDNAKNSPQQVNLSGSGS